MRWTVASRDDRMAVLVGSSGERLQIPAAWIPEEATELLTVYTARMANRTIICLGRQAGSR